MDIETVKLCQACKCNKLIKFFKIKKNGEYNKTCIICNNRYCKHKTVIESTYKPVETSKVCIKCKQELPIKYFRIKKYINGVNKVCIPCISQISNI